MPAARRINVGCGRTPTPGWRNFDNSWSVGLARSRFASVAGRIGLVSAPQAAFMTVARQHGVEWANAARLPVPDASADVVYSSHMLEHLDRHEARSFLREVDRVLRPGGIVRLSVPDLRIHVDNYLRSGDANQFIEDTHLTRPRLESLRARVRSWVVGERHHQWMYDGPSLCKLLRECGFVDPVVLPPNETRMSDPGLLCLDERAEQSVFVEAYSRSR